jgi:multidrug efflux pump subunit AcrA (membrane-fusion protein)
MKLFISCLTWFKTTPVVTKLFLLALVISIGVFVGIKVSGNKTEKIQYQTASVEKGTIISIISASGQITSNNNAVVTTQASGVVKKIFVENGQKVEAGDQIAEIEPDLEGKQRQSQAYASYLGAQNSLANAKAGQYTSQADLFNNWETYMEIAQNSTYENTDGSPNSQARDLPQYIINNDNWLASEVKYKNQQNVLAQAQTSLHSAWLSYQRTSPIVYAPISGTLTGLSLQIGSVLTAQSGSSGNSVSQTIARVKTDASPTVTVSLTEIDAPKISIGDKATITIDALIDKTFTGKVISIDTIGAVSSGVTTYPAIIKFDTDSSDIFSNMSAQANIITDTKSDVLLVPNSSITKQNNESIVKIMKNGQITETTVEIGISSDTQTEIISGVSEGETVVTSSTTGVAKTTTTSAFSSGGGGRAVFGGMGGH